MIIQMNRLVNFYLIAAFVWVLLSVIALFFHDMIEQENVMFDSIYTAYTTVLAVVAVYYYAKVLIYLIRDIKNIEE